MKTWWNGEPAECKRVRVVVGRSIRPTWWCANLEGAERAAVSVTQDSYTFYIDNEDGSGWLKVTKGHGSPNLGHKSLPATSVEVGTATATREEK